MKRYIILTSVIALAACGGGSGGGGGNGVSGQIHNASNVMGNGIVTDDAVASNQNITGMTSAIVVANDGSSSAIRQGSINYMGKQYNIYDLSDVQFRIAENPTMGNFQFHVDGDGRIEQITETLGDVSAMIDRIGETQRFNGPIFEYVSNTNDGAVTHRVVDDGTITMAYLETIAATGANGHWNRIDEILDINTESTGLTFSDFGKFHPVYRSKHKNLTADMLTQIRAAEDYITEYLDNENNTNTDALITYLNNQGYTLLTGSGHNYKTVGDRENEFENDMDYQLFAGGYAINNGQLVETLTPTDGMHFSGKAVGRIYSSIQTGDGYENRAEQLSAYNIPYYTEDGEHNKTYHVGATTYTEATVPENIQAMALSVEAAGHDLAQYYETNGATLSFNGNTATLVMPFSANGFYDVTATKTGDADAVVSFENPSENLPTYLAKDATVDSASSHDSFGYYGINTPTEATGTVQYETEKILDGTPSNPTAWREWEFQAAYGLNKDN